MLKISTAEQFKLCHVVCSVLCHGYHGRFVVYDSIVSEALAFVDGISPCVAARLSNIQHGLIRDPTGPLFPAVHPECQSRGPHQPHIPGADCIQPRSSVRVDALLSVSDHSGKRSNLESSMSA
jgi:hypothetical protein